MPFKAKTPNKAAQLTVAWGRYLLTLLLVAAGVLVLVRLWRPFSLPGPSGWLEAVLLLLAAADTVATLTWHLPLQNALAATLLIALAGGAVTWLDLKTGIPFGPFLPAGAGPKLLGTLPWAIPFLWVVVILNSRGTARLILRPWRKTPSYGFQLIGVTAGLAALFDVALEPFATHVKHYWFWQPTKFPLAWQGAPLSNFFGWAVVTLLVLAFVTPLLINKHPAPKPPPDFHALGVWLGGILLCNAGCVAAGLWLAAAVDAIVIAGVAGFALRGAKW